MSEHIQIKPISGTWVILSGGAVLGETSRALELTEGEMKPVIYVPREDIAMAFLEKSDATSSCPFKGEAEYYHIEVKSGRIENAAWSYIKPTAAAAQIKDYMAFAHERVSLKSV